MEPVTSYEFNVQVWFEDDTWNYYVVQEFDNEGSEAFEALGYGTADSSAEAFDFAAQVVRDYFG